jgi:hypothetical protein
MPEPAEQLTAPTAEQMAQGATVGQAGIEAAIAEPDPTKRPRAAGRAIQKAARAQGWELSDDDCERIGRAVAAQLAAAADENNEATARAVVGHMEARGAFETPPEPIAIPAAPTGTGRIPAAPAAEPAPEIATAPHGRTFAEWFRGAR